MILDLICYFCRGHDLLRQPNMSRMPAFGGYKPKTGLHLERTNFNVGEARYPRRHLQIEEVGPGGLL